jgi:hypothetical protein
MLEFSPDTEMSRVSGLANEFFEKVLYDEEPLFRRYQCRGWNSVFLPHHSYFIFWREHKIIGGQSYRPPNRGRFA